MDINKIIEDGIIEKYKLEDAYFNCPICDEKIISLFINEHYSHCKLEKLTQIQEDINVKNMNVRNENKINYYRILFDTIFTKLSDINFDSFILDYKLTFYKIKNFDNISLLYKSSSEDIETNNIIYLSIPIETHFDKNKNIIIINYDTNIIIDSYSDNVIFLHINNKNLFTKDINNLYNRIFSCIHVDGKIEHKEITNILYFSDFNFIKFIHNCFNIPDESIIVILFAFIKIAILNNDIPLATKLNLTDLTNNEREVINYLTQHNYIVNLID